MVVGSVTGSSTHHEIGMNYLPLEKSPYMSLFSLMQRIKGRPDNNIDHCSILYGDSVLWSDLEHEDSRRIHHYFTQVFFSPTKTPPGLQSLQISDAKGRNSPPTTVFRDGFHTMAKGALRKPEHRMLYTAPLQLYLGPQDVPHHALVYRVGDCFRNDLFEMW